MKNRKITFRIAVLFFSIILATSCKKYLDINSDPDTPQNPDPSAIMPAMLAGMPRAIQFEGRYLGRYTQMFHSTAANDTYDGMGGFQTDAPGEIFRQAYFGLGRNLEYMITQGTKQKQWDYVGVAQAMKSYIFQCLTLVQGEVGWDNLYQDNKYFYSYQSQPVVLKGIDSLCRVALDNLNRTDFDPTYSRLAKGDFVYNGNTALWKKFVSGILARNFLAVMHKDPSYPDSVIKYSSLAMASGADDFILPFDATRNEDANFWGTFRNNLTALRQSKMIVNLLDGTSLAGTSTVANRDPRMPHLLTVSQDTTTGSINGGYRGLTPGVGDPNTTTINPRQRVTVLWGDSLYVNPGSGNFGLPQGKYLFHNKAVFPIMTYGEMQFIRAEAEFAKAPGSTAAYTAYKNGINAHFDFINRGTFPRANVPLYKNVPITTTERNTYLAGANVKQTAALLTKSDIMLQKYIALWGWGMVETWTDMRRYHYIDLDAITGLPVYKALQPLAAIYGDNQGRPVYRIRPRFNSEYVWNINSINEMIQSANSYNTFSVQEVNLHTSECWFSRP
jgi:hypothetical protein